MQNTRAILYRIFYNILLTMEEDWSNVDICNKSISFIMANNSDMSRRCSNVLMSISAAAAICYSMASFLRSANLKEELNISSRVLPIKMEFPFEVDASPLFELLAIGQVLHVVSIAVLVAMINCLVITLVRFTDHMNDVWFSKIY